MAEARVQLIPREKNNIKLLPNRDPKTILLYVYRIPTCIQRLDH